MKTPYYGPNEASAAFYQQLTRILVLSTDNIIGIFCILLIVETAN